MGFINLADKTISAKLVYYGCGNGGKTTSLEVVHEIMRPEVDLVSIKTEEEATLLFDFLPIDLGEVNGFKIRLQGFTVPGQPKYERMRKYVLSGADAVVFVIDSERSRYEENLQSWESLRKNLSSNGLSLDTMPLVLQYNKRDLDDIVGEAELDEAFRPERRIEAFPSVATENQGVFETFVHAAGLLVAQKVRDYGLGKGAVDPEAVAEGARQKLWQIHDEVRGPQMQSGPAQADRRLELTFDYDQPHRASAEEISDLAQGEGEILTDEDLDIELGGLPGAAPAGPGPGLGAPGDDAARRASAAAEAAGMAWLSAEGDPWSPLADGGTPWTPQMHQSEEDARIDAAAIQSSYELARKLGEEQERGALLDRKVREMVKHTQNVVHDLRKPVAVLKLMFQSIQKGLFGEPPKRVTQALDNGMMAIGNMEQLIGDLIDSSRLDFDGVDMKFEEVDMTLLLGQIVTSLRFEVDEQDAVITVEPLPTIVADAWALERAFRNLLGNALRYVHPERRPKIEMTSHREDDRHVFVVADNGIGIPAEDQPRMFERFERGSNTQSVSGTGLGMHIVREIVLGHGGEVWIESEEGQGTRVHLAIPLQPVQPPHSAIG